MRTKKIKIRPRAAFDSELLATARKFDRGEKTAAIRGDYFESIDAVRNILTPRRLQLWQAIRDQKPASIMSLARMVRRDFKSVYQDVQLLAAVGIVGLREIRGSGRRCQEPRSLADTLILEVA